MNARAATALRLANEARLYRADLKARLRSGDARLSGILREGIPDHLGSMIAESLLLMAPGVGGRRVVSLLREAGLGPARQSRHITARQRLVLAGRLEEIEDRRRARRERRRS